MKLLRSLKKLVSASVVGATLYGLVAGGASAIAAGPVFNRMAGDAEFTQGRTQNMSSYSDPVSATKSDRVTVAVYYHNGIVDTTAQNMRVKIDLPTATANKHVIKTTLWADNAEAITDTVVNGQIVGSPDMTINLNEAAAISYVPGSTVWYPDLQTNPDQTGIQLPDGIATGGVRVGNIDGCWEHAGYILFDVAFSANPILETDKWVSLYGGNNQWVKENTAKPGDELIYQILFGNKGNGTAKNVRIDDVLPNEVTYVPGTMSKRILVNNNDTDVAIPDSSLHFNGQTISVLMGDVLPGQDNSGYLYFRVKVKSNLAVGTYHAVNNEAIYADNAPSVSASAKTTITVTPTPKPELHILKEVANISQGGQRWVKENTAKPGDHLQYRLMIYNAGTAPATNVSVKDILPQHVSYVAGSAKIYGPAGDALGSIADSIVTSGVNIGTIQNGIPTGNRFIVFEVTVNTNMQAGNVDLINTGVVYMNGTEIERSTTKTTVTSEIGLLVTKEVWDATRGVWTNNLDVKPGQVITYRILVRNTGNTTMTGILVKDQLPELVKFVAGSSREDGIQISDAWITTGAGQILPNLAAGNFKQLTFDVVIGACPPGGKTKITNRATVTASGIEAKNVSVDVFVNAGAPPAPR